MSTLTEQITHARTAFAEAPDERARMAESIRAAVAADDPGEGFPAPSTSVGWTVFPDAGQDFETLMHSADDRMLRIKRNESRHQSSTF